MPQPAPSSEQEALPLPRHVAIIMDGNGRWAAARGMARTEGHVRGARAVRRIVRRARERGIRNLTLFALSTQNLSRPPEEVAKLFRLFRRFLLQEADELKSRGIRFALIGDRSRLPEEVLSLAAEVEAATADCVDMTLTVAVAYGGQEDLVAALDGLVREGGPVTAETLEKHLWSAHLPPVDLLIRTGGERRISNFLLWHLAYAELCFTDVLWPDFGAAELERSLQDYGRRERRFGQVGR